MNPEDRKELLQRFLQQACLVVESPARSECVAIYNETEPSRRIRCLWGDVGNRDKVAYEGMESLDDLAREDDLSSVVVLARFNFESAEGAIQRGEKALESVMKLWDIPACPSGIWRSLGGGTWGLPALRRWTSGMVNIDTRTAAYARLVSLYFGGTMAIAVNPSDRIFRMWVGPEAAYDESVQKFMERLVGNTAPAQSQLSLVLGTYRDRAWVVRLEVSDRKWDIPNAPAESVAEWKRIVDSCRAAGFPVDMIWRNGK